MTAYCERCQSTVQVRRVASYSMAGERMVECNDCGKVFMTPVMYAEVPNDSE